MRLAAQELLKLSKKGPKLVSGIFSHSTLLRARIKCYNAYHSRSTLLPGTHQALQCFPLPFHTSPVPRFSGQAASSTMHFCLLSRNSEILLYGNPKELHMGPLSAELSRDNHEGNHTSSARVEDVHQLSVSRNGLHNSTSEEHEGITRNSAAHAMALLQAALDEADDGEGKVEEEFQRSLRVGIVGAPNAGKSLLTNQLVGTRVSAVSRKTNTTHREHLGVFTKGDSQLLYYDTPGLHLDIEGSPLRVEAKHRVQNAWQIVDFCEALVILVDAERQIRRPDRRVKRLVEKLGTDQMVQQKRILCLNKVDIIEQKKLLLPLAKEFEDLPGYDRIFMISGLTGSGVKDVKDYLLDQAVLRPWDEDPEFTDHHDIALEIVREQVFEHLHEELPHTTKQKLVSWKVLQDGSIRIQQLLLVPKKEHQKILVGKNGAVIGDIGIKARKELQSILGVDVHLVLDVKMMTGDE